MNYSHSVVELLYYSIYFNFDLKLILFRLFQQHYCYSVTGQPQESEVSYQPARIKERHSKLNSFQASLFTPTATHFDLPKRLHGLPYNWIIGLLNKSRQGSLSEQSYMGNIGHRTDDIA